MAPMLALGDASNAAIAEWAALAFAVISSIVAVAVMWGQMRSDRRRDREEFLDYRRDRERRSDEFRVEQEKRWQEMHQWQHDQDRTTRRMELSQQRVLVRLHRLEDGGGLTPPPKETSNDDE